MNKKPLYHIGQVIYHITPDSPQGIVNNIMYKYLEGYFLYEVSFHPGDAALWYYEHELSTTKKFDI